MTKISLIFNLSPH